MKKQLQLLLIAILATAATYAQSKKDSIPPAKKDTVRVPVVLVQVTDTVPVSIIYRGWGHHAKFAEGYYLQLGLKYPNGKWVQEPKNILVNSRYQKFAREYISITLR